MPAKRKTQSLDIRNIIRKAHICDERESVQSLIDYLDMGDSERDQLVEEAAELVRILRRSKNPGLMETFLAEYGLSTEEGVALMCLAEALLRVPDEGTIDALIKDKISAADWSRHLGHSTSPLVNASTWALMLTGKVISPVETASWDVVGNIRHLIRRAGEPVVRKAVAQSMKILGHQFVLGRNIEEAVDRARGMEEKGYQYSYDMLGEAAHTADDAQKYFLSYSRAIARLSDQEMDKDIRNNPGISVKLSALHPRYEYGQKDRVLTELVPRVASLVLQAKNAQMGFNIDAEEADRLDLSLDVIEAVLSEPDLKGWDGFGIVVQAYGPRAFPVLDWCYDLASRLNRKIMVRLVKGAYWDTEIKNAQVDGLAGYPVFTRKSATDISYMACAKKMLSMTDRLYPQFATHNAHSIVSILKLAGEETNFEFQRLHGMGEALHSLTMEQYSSRCRIYAPVGVHEDLLAYLVRRLLENGANSSFVNQVLDEKVPARHVVSDPIDHYQVLAKKETVVIALPKSIYPDKRKNSDGINFSNPLDLSDFYQHLDQYSETKWQASPIINSAAVKGTAKPVINPSNGNDLVGDIIEANLDDVQQAFLIAKSAQPEWAGTPVESRARLLEKFSELLEENKYELMSVLIREAGKTPLDAIGEVREAVDFCRYYAEQARLMDADNTGDALGVFVCISPWNFPLAIFTGQIVAALVTGNAVLAKPAEQTPLIATLAVKLMHEAGIPHSVLHLLPGEGAVVGHSLVSHPEISGVCFTGSTNTARRINQSMAENGAYDAPLIAETGGLNAMIVDSTALPEQAVRDIVTSAFQSAGQRCSALRILYVQEDIADRILEMLKGAMDELFIGDPRQIKTDVGPVIDEAARSNIQEYCAEMTEKGRLIKCLDLPSDQTENGHFIAPTIFSVSGIEEMQREIFGPVLHFATYKSGEIKKVVSDINKAGFGLTLGLHTRVDSRVQEVAGLANVGNIYVNRNQIGAVVGVQPFGGEGLSGTGPKAGGPLYLHKFVGKADLDKRLLSTDKKLFDYNKYPYMEKWFQVSIPVLEEKFDLNLQELVTRMEGFSGAGFEFQGPTGESNHLHFHSRGSVFIDGENWLSDSLIALLTGNSVLFPSQNKDGKILRNILKNEGLPYGKIDVFDGPSFSESSVDKGTLTNCCLSLKRTELGNDIRNQFAQYEGVIISALKSGKSWREFVAERTLSIDTTASGGNAALLASAEGY